MENNQLNNPTIFSHKGQVKDNAFEPKKLNPTFEDLINPDTILNHVKELKETLEIDLEEKILPFPIEVFPKPVQEIIKATNESLNFPIDFIGASILFAASISIGNTHKAQVKNGWEENPAIYLAIVGRAGTNKSHPISFALKPIEKRDDLNYHRFQKEKLEYDSILAFTKKEKAQQICTTPLKPTWKQNLVSDFTPEALTETLKVNTRGIGVYADELASWFKNFDRYNKGSEEQFWLSVWSGKPLRVNRKTSDPIHIPSPFISVAGTIQPGILNELAKNRTENGFLDRILFVIPDNLKKEYWNETELEPRIVENYQTIISNLLDVSITHDDKDNSQPEILQFTPEAKELLFKWQKKQTDLSNMLENDSISGIHAKMEMYAVRLALCLEMLRFACNESNKKAIGIEAVEGALKLVEYFKRTALKVHSIVSNASPLDRLPMDKQNLYNALPETFTTKEGVLVAQSIGTAERTFKRFLAGELFIYHARGEYEKRY